MYCGNSRLFTPRYPTYGDITSGSNVIENVGRADRYGKYLSNDLVVDDYFFVDQIRDYVFSETASVLTAVTNGSPGLLVLEASVRYTQPRKRL